jgi:hypothetical protein
MVVLFLFQGGARWYRSNKGLHSIPASVEIIVYFSMLDQVTDVTYIAREHFVPDSTGMKLNLLGVVFCSLPLGAMTLYFLVKGYRLITPANLRWRLGVAAKPFTAVPPWMHYTLLYPVIAAVPTFVMAVALFLPLPIEVLVPILQMGYSIGMQRTKEMSASVQETALKWSAQSIILLPVVLLIYIGVALVGLLTMCYWMVLAVTFPVLWAFMMVVRTFCILPKVWLWIESQSDYMTSFLKEPADEGLFQYRPRRSAKCGQDLGIFRIFHPRLDDDATDIPEFDYNAMYLLLSETLVFEFVAESVRTIHLNHL